MRKVTLILFVLGINFSGFSQNIALNNSEEEDYWEAQLTPLIEVNDMLRHIYNNPFTEQFIHTIPAGYPLNKEVNINSFYGFRNHPVHKVTIFHRGIDLKGATGEKALATGDGNVLEVGFKTDLGNYIKIKHCYGFESIYGHLSKISVKKGQFVKRSQVIGEVGSTGTVTGPHLHYTLKKNNHYIDPFDFLFMDYERGKISMLAK
ncbi:M23 family metallopeptidase [Emticicia sp.]|uniref:M23 family metallopeptidase n=1 Tax=Emticicia sp. TaxID=1930953 RepID=UPI003750474C